MLTANNKLIIAACLILFAGFANAETLTYRQFKDVAIREKGQVAQSGDKDNLFEYTYSVDAARKTITRTRIRRLDEAAARGDSTVYTILQRKDLMGSEAGNGGDVWVAVRKDGGEILELGRRFAFTMRISPFSQVIGGVYKRVYDRDRKHFFRRDERREP